MKLLIFAAHYPPHVGGVERYTAGLAAALAARGQEVTVVSSDVGSREEGERDGVRLFRLRGTSLMDGRYPIPLRCGANRDVFHVLRVWEPDGVLICCRFYLQSLLAARFARRVGLTPIVIEHGSGYLRVGRALPDLLFRVYEHGFTRLLRLSRPVFYGVSEDSCRWLNTFGIRARGKLYNAVDPGEIRAMIREPAEDYRAAAGVGRDTVLIAFVSRLLPQKRVRELIEAAETLGRTRDVRLLIAGDGELAEEVAGRASRVVRPLGRLDRPHVAALLAAADIFCLPSDTEGFSTAVLEAAAAGCYLVATAVGGTPELVKEDGGTLLEDSRPETICAALDWACAHPEERAAAAERTRARLEECFTWERTALAAERAVKELREHESADHCAGL